MSSKSVLIIDDSPSLRILSSKWLEKAGYKSIQANDGEEGLRALMLNPDIKVVLLDMMMPKMNGLEFLEKVKMAKGMMGFKVCMLTAKEDQKDIERTLEAGADDYIVKPADEMILVDKVKILNGEKDVNNFYQKPVQFNALLETPEKTENIIISVISESSLVFTTTDRLPDGARVFIHSEELGEWLKTKCTFVLRVYNSERKGALINNTATFVALKDAEYKQIRSMTTKG